MCLAQGPQHSDAGESRVKHSTTEPMRSMPLHLPNSLIIHAFKQLFSKTCFQLIHENIDEVQLNSTAQMNKRANLPVYLC